jgi:Uma2 family endonuclease
MATDISNEQLRRFYEKAAQEYLRSLPLEHFMEATPHATQRKITLESLDLVAARRPDFHLFNELLVQYPIRGQRKPRQVVPDNMVVLYEGELSPEGSYDLPLQPAKPFWVLEYVSKSSKRKDYQDNRQHYEKRLKVPYYLPFDPETQVLTLFHHNGRQYVRVEPNQHGRLALPELDLEVGLLDGWVRFWYQGELLPLPADLQRQFTETQRQLAAEQQARQAAETELARLRAEIEELKRHQNHKR